MVTISRLALSAQENCVIILYFGEEREREGRDTKRENEVGRGDKDRKAEKDERSRGSHRPAIHLTHTSSKFAPIYASLTLFSFLTPFPVCQRNYSFHSNR